MSSEPPSPTPGRRTLLEAVAFAARAHRHHLRKDGRTPYASHAFRVCLVVRDLFGIDDPEVLAAAVLHDTIEDTNTDYDELAEQFGERVARWVAALSKDKRLPEAEREEAYARTLAASEWPVVVCKLADVLDNLLDAGSLPPARRGHALERARFYLDALRPSLPPEASGAYRIAESVLAECRAEASE